VPRIAAAEGASAWAGYEDSRATITDEMLTAVETASSAPPSH
jgi:hypothetical protein